MNIKWNGLYLAVDGALRPGSGIAGEPGEADEYEFESVTVVSGCLLDFINGIDGKDLVDELEQICIQQAKQGALEAAIDISEDLPVYLRQQAY